MIDKRAIAAGFLGGVAIGLAFVLRPSLPKPIPEVKASEQQEREGGNFADSFADKIITEMDRASDAPTTYESMVEDVARQQGGKISIAQMRALADIHDRLYGGSTTYGEPAQFGPHLPTSPRVDAYQGFAGSLPPSPSRVTPSRVYAGDIPVRRYRGSSGAEYQYDLSNPGDEVRYSVDVSAQLRDSIDPRVEIDRSLGQQGGGVQPR